jgi:membrane associated rhomboid family serine protease
VSEQRGFGAVDGLLASASALILLGLWLSAKQGFDPAWSTAHACNARSLPCGLLTCFTTAPWLHLSPTHALLNLFAIAVLWRHLRRGSAAGTALTGLAGSAAGMVAASLLFGAPVAGASALVHALLGRSLAQVAAPLAAFDLLAVSGLLALGAAAPTWAGHVVATLVGGGASILLARGRGPR